MKKYLWVFLLLASNSFAQDLPKSVDVSDFDISGVKLGMSLDEAVNAIKEKYNISDSQIKKSSGLNQVTNESGIQLLSFVIGKSITTVRFEPSVPHDPKRKMLVSWIQYTMPWSSENVKSMEAAVLEKYGPSSYGHFNIIHSLRRWCAKPNRNPGFGCELKSGARLEYAGVTITLDDFTYKQNVIEYMDSKLKTKPSF